jgi:LPS export ABC transporter protein LptC
VKGSIVVILLSVAVLIGVFVLSRNSGNVTAPSSQVQPYEQPGYSARNARVVETDENGRPVYRVEAALVRQRPNDSRVQLAAPRMSLETSEGDTVNVEARSGQIREDGSEVHLFGDVKLNGELSGTPIEVETSILKYQTATELVTVPAPVVFRQRRGSMEAPGLVADLKRGLITLESVNGKFDPKK